MDNNNWRAAQGQVQIPSQVIGGEAVASGGMEGGDWRNQLQPDARQRIVNKIMDTLKRHLPFSGQEGLQELKKIAVRFEEKIYTAATSQSDYLRKISLKMLTMETKSQNPMANSVQPNAASNSKNPQDPGSQSMQSQIQNQVPQLPIPMISNQSQVRQQISSQNMQNPNIASTGMPSSAGGMSQGTMPNVPGQNPNMQNIPSMSNVTPSTVGNSVGQDSSSQTGNASGGDWQEEIYQKIKSMNELYLPDLNDMYQRMAAKLHQLDTTTLPQQPKSEQLEKLRFFKVMLERLIMFLRTSNTDIQPNHKDKIVGVEKQIVQILNSNRPRKAVSSSQQGPAITFGPEDMAGVRFPHNDALVITALIAHHQMSRVFVDGGSSVDIIFMGAFKQMDLGNVRLEPVNTSLYGFGGEKVEPIGQIRLPVSLGKGKYMKTRHVKFLIVDAPSSYNAFLGRPAVGMFEAIASPYHLKLKYPVGNEVGEVRGDQTLARKCNIEAIRKKVKKNKPIEEEGEKQGKKRKGAEGEKEGIEVIRG